MLEGSVFLIDNDHYSMMTKKRALPITMRSLDAARSANERVMATERVFCIIVALKREVPSKFDEFSLEMLSVAWTMSSGHLH